MVFKDADGVAENYCGDNVALRYSISEGLVTTNTPAEIRNAINFLEEQLNNI